MILAHLISSKTIFNSDDVILTQIPTRLHFDNFQRNCARVCESVNFPRSDVGGLVFVQRELFIAIDDSSIAFHHNPVLCSVLVLLKTRTGPSLT